MKEDKSTLRLIKLRYRHLPCELEAALKAWADFPTFKTDCPQERKLKEELRKLRMKKYLSVVN
ncbi:MAG: hypothetical protein QOC35_06405 [Nitrososphaeraceae archaeon]|nr:hypothetical protein [Nitrososphaeraceae archaeon]